MDLRTFIRETLCQISDGMIDAQGALKDKGVRINPPHFINDNGNFCVDGEKNTCYQSIDFDIALTATEDKKATGGMGIAVWVAKIGGEKEKAQSTAAVSRVQFRIAALLPQSISEDAKR